MAGFYLVQNYTMALWIGTLSLHMGKLYLV